MSEISEKTEKPRFVLMYDFLYEAGGLEKLMTIHARFIKKMGYDVKLIFGDVNPKMLVDKNFTNLEVEEYGNNNGKGFVKVFLNLLGKNKINKVVDKNDIIISYSFPANFTMRKLDNKKVFYMNHFPNFLYLPLGERFVWANNLGRKISFASGLVLGSVIKRIDRKLVKKNAVIFENSIFTKSRIDPIYGIDGVVCYPPVGESFKPKKTKKVLKKYDIKNKFVLLSGRLIPDKRVDWLLRAFSMIKNKDVDLIICGQASEKDLQKIKELAKKLGIEDRFKFLGLIPFEDLINLYGLAEVYAFPAPKEDFGLVPAEAISCGTPCVVWGDNSGPTEQIIDSVNGYHAKPYLIEDFALKIDKMLDENLKKKNQKKIVESAKKFSEKTQFEIFSREILKVVNS